MVKCTVSLTTLLLFFLAAAAFSKTVSADQGSAQNAISSAESTMKSCFNEVRQAESSGVDVTALLATLNNAAELLTKAKLAYASNNFDSAFDYASQSRNQLNDFFSKVSVARENAIGENGRKHFTIVLSIVFSAAILSAGVASYFSLSRKERRNADDTKNHTV